MGWKNIKDAAAEGAKAGASFVKKYPDLVTPDRIRAVQRDAVRSKDPDLRAYWQAFADAMKRK